MAKTVVMFFVIKGKNKQVILMNRFLPGSYREE